MKHSEVDCMKSLVHALPRAKQLYFTFIACMSLLACNVDVEDNDPTEIPLRPVKVIEVSPVGGARQRILAATVISSDSQDLSFRVAGSITRVPVIVGDRLRAEDLVATLDSQPFILAVKEAKAQLAQAQASYRNAESQHQRTRELYSTEAASLSELENSKADASSALANRALAEEGLKAAQLDLGYSELKSPSDNCQVVSVPIAVNQNVSAGQTIVTTACGDQLRLRTVVPESLINSMSLGMSVTANLQSSSVDVKGNVVEIAVSNTNGSGYAVEIELESPPVSVRAGMAAEVTMNIDSQDERILVPLISVMSDSDERFVFIAEPENDHYRIVRQVVETGELDNNGIEIISGVEIGQRVVAAGMSRIGEGMAVLLYNGLER